MIYLQSKVISAWRPDLHGISTADLGYEKERPCQFCSMFVGHHFW